MIVKTRLIKHYYCSLMAPIKFITAAILHEYRYHVVLNRSHLIPSGAGSLESRATWSGSKHSDLVRQGERGVCVEVFY